jgi:hypothetical protein
VRQCEALVIVAGQEGSGCPQALRTAGPEAVWHPPARWQVRGMESLAGSAQDALCGRQLRVDEDLVTEVW